MKRFTILLDGMADRAQDALGGKTPMEAASKPGLDSLIAKGKPGTVLTIPPGMETGSAVANMNLLGYDPAKVYKGRAVIEAAGAGIPVEQGSLYIRCNFVTLSGDNFENSVMDSYSAHDVETELSRPLVDRLNKEVFGGDMELINTDTFRNILVVKGKAELAEKLDFMPPHDMIGQKAGDYSHGEGVVNEYYDLMRKAYKVLKEDNDTKANAIWFWGASYAPSFGEAREEKRAILAETTLMRGIAALSGTDCKTTDESNGFIKFLKDKKSNAIKALKEYDFAYIHIQKLDDLSHELLPKEKTKALEQIDEFFIRPFFKELNAMGEDYSCVIASDHFTFSDNGSHGGEPSPFILLGQGNNSVSGSFTEETCKSADFCLTAKELVKLQMGDRS